MFRFRHFLWWKEDVSETYIIILLHAMDLQFKVIFGKVNHLIFNRFIANILLREQPFLSWRGSVCDGRSPIFSGPFAYGGKFWTPL